MMCGNHFPASHPKMKHHGFHRTRLPQIGHHGDKTSKHELHIHRFVWDESWNCWSAVDSSLLTGKSSPQINPKHLLWCLVFLKICGTESTMAAPFNTAKCTHRVKTWDMTHIMHDVPFVSDATTNGCCTLSKVLDKQ